MRTTRAIIHLDNLTQNIQNIKTFIEPGAKMCVAVKADAYGHGAVECAKTAVKAGADFLAVATADEGKELREAGIQTSILLLSLCSPEEVSEVVANSITPLVFDEDYITLFADTAKKQGKNNYTVHLAIDSGMGRIGAYPEDAGKIAKKIVSSGLHLGGVCTHFATSDGISDKDKQYTDEQFKRFCLAIDNIRKEGIEPGLRHCCASAATLVDSAMHMDMVRPGIIVYGYYADDVNKDYLKTIGTPLELKEVMTLESEVCAIRQFKKGMSVSYGRTWTAEQDTEIAVLPVGYGDGLLRRFAQSGFMVAINGKNYPIVGRICMDQCMVNLGLNSGVKRWDKAVLFGSEQDGALQNADDIARATGTISYEITSCITKRVPRLFCK